MNQTQCRIRKRGRRFVEIAFSRFTATFSIIAIVSSFFLPPDGIGFDICWIKRIYELPCPGCGLTRSVTCISHLRLSDAWNYHPFGIVLYAIFVANVIVLSLPKAMRRDVFKILVIHNRETKTVYFLVVFAFLFYGSLRCFLVGLDGSNYPHL